MLEVLVLELILTDDDDEDDWVGDDFLSSQNQVQHWFADAGAFDADQMFLLVSPGQEYRSGNLLYLELNE